MLSQLLRSIEDQGTILGEVERRLVEAESQSEEIRREFVESLSILPTGTCILAGLLAQIPVVVDIGPITPKEDEPDNRTPELIKNWQDEDQEDVA